jgi:hypothetical protein
LLHLAVAGASRVTLGTSRALAGFDHIFIIGDEQASSQPNSDRRSRRAVNVR